MRKRAAVFLASLFALTLLVPFPYSEARVPVGGWTSPNVEWLGSTMLSRTPDAVSGFAYEGYFYAEGIDAIEIFDISEPAAPRSVGRIPFPAPIGIPGLDGRYDVDASQPDTNGEILVFGAPGYTVPGYAEDRAGLLVYDISDKANPELLSVLPTRLYSFECVLDCRWVYGSGGEIIDLRDPRNPEIKGHWDGGIELKPPGLGQSDVDALTEVSPGRIMIAATPMYFLDARADPARPRVLARSDASPFTLGGVAWPLHGNARVAISFSEHVLPPRCEAQEVLRGSSYDSAVKTWDTRGWRRTGLITGLHEYRLENGTYTDGDPALSGLDPEFWGCGPTSVDPNPSFSRHPLVVVGASGHGAKFLSVDAGGRMEEVGWYLPYEGGLVLGAYWITDEIVYAVGWPRGIDILRIDPSA